MFKVLIYIHSTRQNRSVEMTEQSKVLSLKMSGVSLQGRLSEYGEALQGYGRTLSIFNTLSRITYFS